MSDDSKHFSPDKIFIWLFLFTALEVGWGMIARDWGKLSLWGGLGFFAFLKAWLIAVYFMHLKFEGWVVKSLMIPTPLLILVIYGYVSPDIQHGYEEDTPAGMDYPIGSMYVREKGEVSTDLRNMFPPPGHGGHAGDADEGGEAAEH